MSYKNYLNQQFFRAIIEMVEARTGFYDPRNFMGSAQEYAQEVAAEYVYGGDQARQFPGGYETYRRFVAFAEAYYMRARGI